MSAAFKFKKDCKTAVLVLRFFLYLIREEERMIMIYKQIILKYKGTILFYIINGMVQITVANLSLVYFQRLIDVIVKGYNETLPFIIVYGSLKITEHVLGYLDEYPHRKLSNGIYQSFKIKAAEKIARIDYLSYQDIGMGRLIQIIENGATAGKQILFDFYLQILKELLPGVIITLIFIGKYNLEVMIAITAGYVVVFLLTNLLLKHLYKIKKSIIRYEEDLSKFSVRSFMELVVFRISKLFKIELERIKKTSDQIVNTRTKIRMIHESFFLLFALLVIVIKLVILLYGAQQVIKHALSVGTILVLITYVDKIYLPIAIFNVLFIDYKLDKVAFLRFIDLIELPDDLNLENGDNFQVKYGAIELKDVSFQYQENLVLKKLSLMIETGQSIALVGKSGGGKSTISKLMLGLLKPSAGEVIIDGVDLATIKLNDYYNDVTYLSQDVPIFNGTVRENIIFQHTEDDEKIYEILEKVDLKEVVLKLPQKLDTELGERGIKLSGGEKQRLAFARVIFQNSKIVILDEPTSALDSITEEQIINNLLELIGDRTLIIIAHRLKTIKGVDNIFVLEDGQVKENGDFKTLIKQRGIFYDLWKKQI